MFYENPAATSSRVGPTGPKIPLRRRTNATGPKISQGRSKISRPVGVLMITVAALIDFSQFILTLVPFVGWIASMALSVFAWILFGLWFFHYGVSLFEGKRALGTLGAMLGEAIPFINNFPLWTGRVVAAIMYEWRRGGGV